MNENWVSASFGETSTELVALLHSDSAGGQGSYNSFDQWSVSLRSDAESVGARLVSVHEAMHATLHDVTAYGLLLTARVLLNRLHAGEPGNAGGKKQLVRLVDVCRGTQEAFATFESLWMVAGADTGWLIGYPDYREWFKDASDLVGGPDASLRKELMVRAALLACMQPPVLESLATDASPSSTAWSPSRLLRPDERLGLLHENLEDQFWSMAWAKCMDIVPDAELILPSQQAAHQSDLPDGLEARCVVELYSQVAELLRRHGAETLDYDGHRRYSAGVIAAVEEQGAHMGALLAAHDDRALTDEVFDLWDRERLILREQPRRAVLRRMTDVLRSGLVDVVSEMQGVQHVFASVRPAGRLLEQFEFDDKEAGWLRRLNWTPVVSLRTTAPTGVVEHTLVEDPEQMTALASALPRGVGAYCNLSLAFAGDDAWLETWIPFMDGWKLSGLFDLSPSDQFNRWRHDEEQIVFARSALGPPGSDQGSLIALRVGGSSLPLLAICSAVAANAIEHYLSSQLQGAERDLSLVRGAAVEVPVNHILGEERFVDFAAYPQD